MGLRAIAGLAVLLVGQVSIPPASKKPAILAAKVDSIAPRLSAKSSEERLRAERELKALGPDVVVPLMELSYAGDRSVREVIEPIVASLGRAAAPLLANVLVERRRELGVPFDAHWSYYALVLSRLDGIVPELNELFLRGMKSPYSFSAVEGVIAVRPELAREVLVPYLGSGNPQLATMAARILSTTAGPDLAPELVKALAPESNASVLHYSIQAVSRLHVRSAIPPLLRLLSHESWVIREGAAGALGLLYDPGVRIQLARVAAWDWDRHPRRAGAYALRNSRDPNAVRLGERYLPTNENPFISVADYILKAVRLLLGGVGAFVLFSWGVRTREKWQMVALSRVALLAWGIYWGRVITRFNGYEELTLLAIVFPLAAATAGYGRGQLGLVRDILGAIVLIPLATIALFMLLQFWSRGLGGELYAFDYSARIALLALVFAVGLAAWRTFKASRNKTDQPLLLSSVRAGSGFLYFGYALGYLALWGYLGF